MDNTQKWHSMAEAYRNVYEASAKIKSAGKELDVSDGTDSPKPHPPHHPYPLSFYPALGRKVEVTKNTVNIDVTKDYVGPGGVEKAYYTYPASFDPTNREDVAKEQKQDGSTARYPSVQKEDALEVVGDYLMEKGFVDEAESVDAFFEHMSDQWKNSILEDAMGKTMAILKKKYGHDPEANKKAKEERMKNQPKAVSKTSFKGPKMSMDKAMGYGMGKYQGD